MNDLESLVENYINGNLSDAKKLAQNESLQDIKAAFDTYAGYSYKKASLTAEWLKGYSDSRQEACDAD